MTKEQLKMFGIDGELDGEAKQEFDELERLKKKFTIEQIIEELPNEEMDRLEQDELELLDNLNQKKLKEAINIARANSDFRDEDIADIDLGFVQHEQKHIQRAVKLAEMIGNFHRLPHDSPNSCKNTVSVPLWMALIALLIRLLNTSVTFMSRNSAIIEYWNV